MRRQLSAPQTRLIKIGVPLGLCVAYGAGQLVTLVHGPAAPPSPSLELFPGFRFVVGALSALFWGYGILLAIRLKVLTLDGDSLRIAGLREDAELPLRRVEAVSQPWWLPGVAIIELRAPTDFGDKIWFLPARPRVLGWGPSATVTDLRTSLLDIANRRQPGLYEEPTDYRTQWGRYTFWHRAFWLTLVTYFPGVFFLGSTLRPLVGENVAFPLAWVAWVIPFFVTSWKLQGWPCPRCGLPFFSSKWGFRLPHFVVRRCRHCGLPKGEPEARRAAA